ncbi:GntR family transcriptional regulator [Bauldia sp.]|uniref:GntR family transcriptional regulator n=1 Tax=Bauldia sp. TaxID=2575872 RepID=UPI003BA92184
MTETLLITSTQDPGEADSLANRAYRAIRSMILARTLKGGETVSEDRLANRLSISRTPVREALFLLQSEGLIEKQVNQPFRVRVVSNREYFQTMRLRELLEGEAIAMATGKIDAGALDGVEADMLTLKANPAVPAESHWAADEKLHDMIADTCGNDVMAGVIRELRVTTRIFELSGLPSRFRPDTEEHLAIIAALRSEDPQTARETMVAHIRSLANDVLAAMAAL